MTDNTVWKGRFLEAVVENDWEYVRRPGGMSAAVILAVTETDEIVLVEQYRVPLGTFCLELPAGLVGDNGPEEVLTAARRELEEETGFQAETLEDLGMFTSSPGMTNEHFTLVRATGLTRVGAGGGVDGEAITVHRVPLQILPDFITEKRRAGVMIDVRLLAALTLL